MTNSTELANQDQFQISFVLSRVLTSGVIMSIEKNETELKGLEKTLGKLFNKQFISLFNCYTGAVHAGLWGQDINYGGVTNVNEMSESNKLFINWLGIKNSPIASVPFQQFSLSWNNISHLDEVIESNNASEIILLDMTSLGFGPAAALLTNNESVYKKAERLKIFGAFDLRTMWTQIESERDIKTGVQFNYRLSPLVGACIKLVLLRRKK
jgi:hypothetical protein